jgi:cephalosporin hydroxylase
MQLDRPVEWISETRFIVDGLEFRGDLATYQEVTTPDRVVILKDSRLLRQYLDFLRPYCINNVLELGIWQGGSPLFYALATDARKIVAVDIKHPGPEALNEIIQARAIADKVKLHFGVSQDDRAALTAIMDKEFAGEPIDLVIDDASHSYEYSRRSFDIGFPRLRPGGFYIIEDWQWAHVDNPIYQKGEEFGDQPALTNLVFELLVAYGGNPDLFLNITVRDWFVAVQKGSRPVGDDFRLADMLRMRGKQLTLI